jgi:hypothetical protein
MSTEQTTPAPAIGVSLEVKLDQGRSLVLQTHVARENPAELDSVLDVLTKSADRQDAKYRLAHMRRLLHQAEQNLSDTEAAIGRVYNAAKSAWADGERRGEFKVEGAAAVDISNSEKTAIRFREEIAAHQAEIERLENMAK